jgi:hypothetical protein
VLLLAPIDTLPLTAPPGPVSVKLDDVTVAGLTASENATLIVLFTATPVLPGVGVLSVTVGAVVSGGAVLLLALLPPPLQPANPCTSTATTANRSHPKPERRFNPFMLYPPVLLLSGACRALKKATPGRCRV